jgi:hypothetical protein
MNQYIQFCADRLLRELKQPTIYNVINPSHGWVLFPSKAKQTCLRNEWAKMQKMESILATSDPSITYSLLMNSSNKACNKSHLPILLHLSTYLCYPNLHSTRSWTSYMVLLCLAILTARHYLYVIQTLEKIKL